jgi:hypothetical protein
MTMATAMVIELKEALAQLSETTARRMSSSPHHHCHHQLRLLQLVPCKSLRFLLFPASHPFFVPPSFASLAVLFFFFFHRAAGSKAAPKGQRTMMAFLNKRPRVA